MKTHNSGTVVSIIMPMKNTEAFVKKAVSSILAQTYPHFELIVVDDLSNDSSRREVESISDHRIRVVENEGAGIASAFNTGLALAEGEYLCKCDSDDLFPVDRLEKQLALFKENKKIIAICTKYAAIDDDDAQIIDYQTGDGLEFITSEFYAGKTRTSFCTFMVLTKIVKKVGGCRDFFVTAEDIDLQLRLSQFGEILYAPYISYFYRIHDSSITHSQPSNQRIYYESLARDFHRQRLNRGYDDLESGISPKNMPSTKEKAQSSELQIRGYLVSYSWQLHRQGKKREAIRVASKVCKRFWYTTAAWKNLIMILCK